MFCHGRIAPDTLNRQSLGELIKSPVCACFTIFDEFFARYKLLKNPIETMGLVYTGIASLYLEGNAFYIQFDREAHTTCGFICVNVSNSVENRKK